MDSVGASVLSSRWRHLWPRRTKFEFTAITVLDAHTLKGRHLDGEEAYNLTKGKTAKFIRSVNSVMQQLQVASKTKILRMHLFRPFSNHGQKYIIFHVICYDRHPLLSLLSQLELLWVEDCPLLRKIDINAVNLLQVDYEGTLVDFKFRQSSKLNKAHIFFKTEGTHNPNFYLAKLSSSLPHLQSLSLKIIGVSEVADLPKVSSRFTYLTHLDCEWSVGFKMNLFHLDTLLDVTPSLKELKLCLSERLVEQPPKAPHKFRQMLNKHPNSHLKTVLLRNFYFDIWQIEIAAYLLNNVTELESLTIEKGSKPSWFASKEVFDRGTEILSQQVPANVRLVIL